MADHLTGKVRYLGRLVPLKAGSNDATTLKAKSSQFVTRMYRKSSIGTALQSESETGDVAFRAGYAHHVWHSPTLWFRLG